MLSSALKIRSKGSESLITPVSGQPSLFGGSSIGGCSIGGSSLGGSSFGGSCFGGSSLGGSSIGGTSVGGSSGDSLIETLQCYDNQLVCFRSAHLFF